MADAQHTWQAEFMALWWARQRAQWDVWAHGADRDLGTFDADLHAFCQDHAPQIDAEPGRAGEVWRRRATRILVDTSPRVAECRHWTDRALFVDGIEPELTAVRGRVLELMSLRDAAAREHGHESYPDLVFWDEELPFHTIYRSLTRLVAEQAEERRQAQKDLGLRSLPDWFSRLGEITPAPTQFDVLPAAQAVLERIGLDSALARIHFEAEPGRAAGFVLDCGPHDIRLSLRESPAPALAFHELGHAVGRALNRDAGILRLLPASTDEMLAEGFELIAEATPEFEAIYGGASSAARHAHRVEEVLDNARLFASFSFEMKLWQDRSAPEDLYRSCYSEMDIDVGDETLWPLDSFRSLDPVYVHNYILARLVAEAALSFLRGHVSAEPSALWGKWLDHSFYAEGAKTSLIEKAARLGALDPFRREV